MKFGFSLSNNQGIEDVQAIFRLATRAEELGFDSVWASDHVFNVSYVYERLGNRPYYDPLSILSYVAAITENLVLGTSVLVLPYHNPMRLAKAAATLDVMSGGRLALGVGVGVIEQELNALGSPFHQRGAITNESIAIMKELWTQDDPSFQGEFYSFSGMKFSPSRCRSPTFPCLSEAPAAPPSAAPPAWATAGTPRPCPRRNCRRTSSTCAGRPRPPGETTRRSRFPSASRCREEGPDALPWEPTRRRSGRRRRLSPTWGWSEWSFHPTATTPGRCWPPPR